MSRPVDGRTASRPGRNGPARPTTRAEQQRASTAGRRPSQGSGRGPGRGSNGRGAGRNGSGPPSRAVPRRSPTSLLTWGAVALVLVIVIVLVVIKISGGGPNGATTGPPPTPASASVVADVTGVPGSVYNTIGINSSVAPIDAPVVTTGQPKLSYQSPSGATLPGVYFYGAEYCPYCAAERWVIIAALSRFGSFKGLDNMQSSGTDVFPNTQTFTFAHSTYTSKYIAFRPQEYYSNQANTAGGYDILQNFKGDEEALVKKYDSSTYFPGSLQQGENGFPFIDFGNKVLSSSSYSPSLLQQVTRDEIAAGLNDPKNPVTQAIIASANYLTAGTCAIDGQQPASVCTSKGVMAAAKALKLTS